jgi:hypothetical protein
MGLKPLPLHNPLSLSVSSARYGRARSRQLKLSPRPLINYRHSFLLLCFVTSLLSGAGPVQPVKAPVGFHRVNPQNAHVRIIAVVPLIGTGTNADPIRPDYVPAPPFPPGLKPSKLPAPDLSGIIGFHFVMSDDKKHAIAEFVAHDPSAFKQIMADRRPDVRVFEKGKAKRADIEVELKKFKKDIDLDRWIVRAP